MSLAVLIWFAIPIGIYTIIFELKSKKKYNALFENFYQKSIHNPKLSQKEKHNLMVKLLQKNGYEIIKEDSNLVVGEKRVLSLGWIILGIGFLYIGVIFYIAYYYFFQKPHRLIYKV